MEFCLVFPVNILKRSWEMAQIIIQFEVNYVIGV